MTSTLVVSGDVVVPRQVPGFPDLPAAPVAWTAPEPSSVSAVAADLGKRLPPGIAPHNPAGVPRVHRLDLLARHLEASTCALAVRWLAAARRSSPATRRSYCDDLLSWAVWLAEHRGKPLDLATLTRDDVTAWRDSQSAAGRKVATVARRLTAISSLYRYGQSYDPSITCPVHDDDHRPRVERGRTASSARVLDAGQVRALAAAAQHDVRDAAVVGILVTTGIRVSELCAADVDDLDAGWLTVRRKGGRTERVSIPAAVAALVDAYRSTRPGWTGTGPAPLVARQDGRRMDRHHVAGLLRRLARRAGVDRPEKVTPHSVRASVITDLIDRRRPLDEVREFAGHGDVRTTMRYVERHGQDARLTAMSAELATLLPEDGGAV